VTLVWGLTSTYSREILTLGGFFSIGKFFVLSPSFSLPKEKRETEYFSLRGIKKNKSYKPDLQGGDGLSLFKKKKKKKENRLSLRISGSWGGERRETPNCTLNERKRYWAASGKGNEDYLTHGSRHLIFRYSGGKNRLGLRLKGRKWLFLDSFFVAPTRQKKQKRTWVPFAAKKRKAQLEPTRKKNLRLPKPLILTAENNPLSLTSGGKKSALLRSEKSLRGEHPLLFGGGKKKLSSFLPA